MSGCKKALCLLLAALMSLSAAFCAAAEDTAEPIRPLDMQVVMSRPAYFVSAEAEATVRIRNADTQTVRNVTVSAFSEKHLLVHGSESNLTISELKAGETKEYTFKMVLNRHAAGVTFFERVLLFFAQLFRTYDPMEAVPASDGSALISQKVTFRHGLTNAVLDVNVRYESNTVVSNLWQTNVVDILNGNLYTVSDGEYTISYNNGEIFVKDSSGNSLYEEDAASQNRVLAEVKSKILGMRAGYTLAGVGSSEETYSNGKNTLTICYSSAGMDHVVKDDTYYAWFVKYGDQRPQVTYMDKYVKAILKSGVYSAQLEVKAQENNTVVPVTLYKNGSSTALETPVGSLISPVLNVPPSIDRIGSVRFVYKTLRAYMVWNGGYVEIKNLLGAKKLFDEMLGRAKTLFKQIDSLQFCGRTNGTDYVCETYEISGENTQYLFYFTTTDDYTGICRWEAFDPDTGRIESQTPIRLVGGLTNKNAFAVTGTKYAVSDLEDLFGE